MMLLLTPSTLWAQSNDTSTWLFMRLNTRNVERDNADVFLDLLQGDLATQGNLRTLNSPSSCTDTLCAVPEGRKANADVVVFGSINALGSDVIVSLTAVDVSSGQVANSQRITVDRLEDLDNAATRLARAFLEGKDVKDTAELGSITRHDPMGVSLHSQATSMAPALTSSSRSSDPTAQPT